jgi:lipopolysaccharide/colanic/teichoic acid biosynthesis glycosyltransferase
MDAKINNRVNQYLIFRYTFEKVFIILLSPFIILLFLSIFLYIGKFLKKKIIFKQLRPGRNCIPFVLYKFRTMDDNGNIIPALNFIRLHRLDEILQLYNVLKGDMSLIGPRPEPLDYFNRITEAFPEYKHRYIIKPGLTGLAQVEFQHTLRIEESIIKYEYDLKYIKTINFLNDIKIIFKTFSVLFNSKGAK